MGKKVGANATYAVIVVLLSIVLVLGPTVADATGSAVKLTVAEMANLRFIREEEKLARDIYNVLGEMWGLKIFIKIAENEQRHTDAVRLVIEKYGVSDPAKATPPAVFVDKRLQELYLVLLSEGKASSLEALKVGALTEEKDISDINRAVGQTNRPDLLELYAYLKDGSSVHLRGFMAQIRAAGGDYSPQFISQEEFDVAMRGSK